MERIAQLNHDIEAGALHQALDAEGIGHAIHSYHDSAYDGIFQLQQGWGCVEAEAADGPRILEILEGIRAGVQEGEA